MASITFKQGSRPRKRSSVSYPALPQHNRRPSFSPSSPLDENYAKSFPSASNSSYGQSTYYNSGDSLRSYATVSFAEKFLKILFLVLMVFFFLSKMFASDGRPHYQKQMILDTSKVSVTFEPRIVPNVAELPQVRAQLVRLKEHYVPSTYIFDPDSKTQFPIVIVTTIDLDKYSAEDAAKIIQNREQYAKIHGFALYVRYAQDFIGKYHVSKHQKASWAKIYTTRAAMTAFPTAQWVWYVDANILISNMHESVYEQLLSSPKAMESRLIRKVPVVKATDYIRTFQYTKAHDIQLIMSQDDIGLNPASFLLRNGEWAASWLDFWGDQTLLTYNNFDRGDASALNHLIQWHVSYLSKLGLIAPEILAHSWLDKDGAKSLQFVTWFNCDFGADKCHDKFVEQFQLASASAKEKRT